MFLFGLSVEGRGFDPLILLLCALVAEFLVGRVELISRLPGHPAAIVGAWASWFDHKLNRETRSQMDRAIRGGLVVSVVLVIAIGFAWLVAWYSQTARFGWMLELLLLVVLVGQGRILRTMRTVRQSLDRGDVEAARAVAGPFFNSPANNMDAYAIARNTLEAGSTRFSSDVVGPVIWYVVFGLPGMAAYATVSALAEAIGRQTPRHRAFGFSAARLDYILSFVPARLSGLFIALACLFVATTNPRQAVGVMLRDSGKHRSPNDGWPLAATAGGLDLALGGPVREAGQAVEAPWLGDGRARTAPLDLRRASHLITVGCLINAVWLAALTVVRFD